MAEAVKETFGQRLSIATGTEVMLEIHGFEGKVRSKLIGLLPDEFLIITAPVGVSGVRQRLFEGNKLTLRYMYRGFVYGFETHIITLVSKPRSMLILHYPQKSASVTLRKSERVDCFIACTLAIENEGYNGMIMDISPAGCRCLVPMLPEKLSRAIDREGIEAKLTFIAANDNKELEAWVRIVNHSEEKAASKLGLSFVEPDDETLSRLNKMCEFLDR